MIEKLKLKHQSEQQETTRDMEKWSPVDICEAWAVKRGYFTAKAARPDVYR
jgi:hypothetical protein